ncbi:hypothetical protein FN846DRAFT_998048 [Sphaerosporella brunnea]|uniref:Uncharacterized protein n=1 Tax=Sphaerosporella brunnea TaxID=1250544 RepID=A0A5J5F5Z1_9PEZI|nr:hypothetical protein FN846DRAFT_998048 [Sphaerosporella brunnea]
MATPRHPRGTENTRVRSSPLKTPSGSVRSTKTIPVLVPPGTVAAAASRLSTPKGTPPAHTGTFRLSPLRSSAWKTKPTMSEEQLPGPASQGDIFSMSPTPAAKESHRLQLPEIDTSPIEPAEEWFPPQPEPPFPRPRKPESFKTTASSTVDGIDYAAHLRPATKSSFMPPTKPSLPFLPTMAPPSQRPDYPTAALYAENVQPMHPVYAPTRRPLVIPSLAAQLGEPQRDPSLGGFMHQRTYSTLSVASVTSIHGSNLPGWDEFDVLPRGEEQLTSFPKYQTNSMRSSNSLKRIGAKIMGEEPVPTLSGVARFFGKMWMRKQQPQQAPARRGRPRQSLRKDSRWSQQDIGKVEIPTSTGKDMKAAMKLPEEADEDTADINRARDDTPETDGAGDEDGAGSDFSDVESTIVNLAAIAEAGSRKSQERLEKSKARSRSSSIAQTLRNKVGTVENTAIVATGVKDTDVDETTKVLASVTIQEGGMKSPFPGEPLE